MQLLYAPPPDGLADYVSAFYLFEAEVEDMREIERADVAQLRVALDGEASVHFADGRQESFHPVSIFGPRMKASQVVARGPKLRLFGCGILPSGWDHAIDAGADQCADKVFAAEELMPIDSPALVAALQSAPDFETMVSIVSTLALELFGASEKAPLWFVQEVDKWLMSDLNPPLSQLQATTGLSLRQIERRCRQYYGAPPKALVRKYRALRAANAIANANGDWRDMVDAAYYDQSHFIREMKEFIGMTPSAIRDARSPLSALAFSRSQLAGMVSPLVSST